MTGNARIQTLIAQKGKDRCSFRFALEAAMRETYDLFIIGGGINGCGIARDAAGRGLTVGLAEMGDLAGATSSSSTKLFHGGLRYLEYWEIRLVREALAEREKAADWRVILEAEKMRDDEK